jgi:hypothetical protein
MPTALTLRLRPFRPWRPDTRQLHGLACTLIEQAASDHTAQQKRFAVWPIAADPADPHVGLVLRCAWLGDGAPPFTVEAAAHLRLGSSPCTVVEVQQRDASFVRLATGPAGTSATLQFRSPTYFSHNGQDLVVPEPRLILGSYRRRWNESLPPGFALQISDELWQRTHRAAQLVAYDLHTAAMDSGRGHQRVGFVGAVTLALAAATPVEVRSAFSTLIRFATYSGTGAQTTHGFGATTSSLSSDASSNETVGG